MPVNPNWFEDFFHGITLDLWRKAIPPAKTVSEADFLIRVLECAPGAHLLDVPCGNGRLSFELAKRGYQVTGVDISEEFIDEARSSVTKRAKEESSASTTPSGMPARGPRSAGGSGLVEFILGDMRSIEGSDVYDGAYCFGNSFGFMPYADMEKFLSGVARALKPSARFILETGMAAESILTHFEEQSCYEVGDITMTVKERYLASESCIDSEYIFERDGQKESRFAKHWIYTTAEIRRMLERAGFEVLDVYGSLKCEPYKLASEELFVVSEARA
ncbi:MAG TPA: class I SAM-dependent methyltransferase [Pyrinomonadaceae bacterium]|nr:class I SAM-dependent methyltransferase [Pyrinomonadaceae bacterium]